MIAKNSNSYNKIKKNFENIKWIEDLYKHKSEINEVKKGKALLLTTLLKVWNPHWAKLMK